MVNPANVWLRAIIPCPACTASACNVLKSWLRMCDIKINTNTCGKLEMCTCCQHCPDTPHTSVRLLVSIMLQSRSLRDAASKLLSMRQPQQHMTHDLSTNTHPCAAGCAHGSMAAQLRTWQCGCTAPHYSSRPIAWRPWVVHARACSSRPPCHQGAPSCPAPARTPSPASCSSCAPSPARQRAGHGVCVF